VKAGYLLMGLGVAVVNLPLYEGVRLCLVVVDKAWTLL
jgi:hypothetical protein